MYSQVVGTAQDCSMLIDALPAKLPELSMENGVGCCGISQGGHFALSLLVNEPRIDVAVALIGAGDYEENMRVRYQNLQRLHEESGTQAPEWAELWPPATAAMVKKYDPIHNLDAFRNRPCLLLNGAADPLVPDVANRQLLAALRTAGQYADASPFSVHEQAPAFCRGTKLEMISYPGVKHETPAQMVEDTVRWFHCHLGLGLPVEAL